MEVKLYRSIGCCTRVQNEPQKGQFRENWTFGEFRVYFGPKSDFGEIRGVFCPVQPRSVNLTAGEDFRDEGGEDFDAV